MDKKTFSEDLWSTLLVVLEAYYCAVKEGDKWLESSLRNHFYNLASLLAGLGSPIIVHENVTIGLHRLLIACPLCKRHGFNIEIVEDNVLVSCRCDDSVVLRYEVKGKYC